MGCVTQIFALSKFSLEKEVWHGCDVWYPEVTMCGDRPVPIHPAKQIENAHTLVGKSVATDSEYIILWFLREISDGRMSPSELDLRCDGKRIRIDIDGELIDKWPGGFYRERAALLF